MQHPILPHLIIIPLFIVINPRLLLVSSSASPILSPSTTATEPAIKTSGYAELLAPPAPAAAAGAAAALLLAPHPLDPHGPAFSRRWLYLGANSTTAAPSPELAAAAEQQYTKAAIIYVAAVLVCMAACAFAYCIAHKLIQARRGGSSASARASSRIPARTARVSELPDSDDDFVDGLDASLLATLPVLPYGCAVKLAMIEAGTSCCCRTTGVVEGRGGDGQLPPVVSCSEHGVDAESGGKNAKKVSMPAVKECAVCLNDFVECEEVKLLPACGHCFHVECIDMWLSSHTTCPICRLCVFDQHVTNSPLQDYFVLSISPTHWPPTSLFLSDFPLLTCTSAT